jgi:hypothetical protein
MRNQSRQKRYPSQGEFEGSELPLLHGRKTSAIFRGRVKDISDGGFCLFADRAPKESALIQGHLKLANVPAHIPTLVQVRWVAPPTNGRDYRIGFRYMI